jgi:5-methylcytosine-specific restriction endonuclease McrA
MPHGKSSKRAALWGSLGMIKAKFALRQVLLERDGPNCRHCGRLTRKASPRERGSAPDVMTIDHWPIPKRELPVEEWLDPARCVIACGNCNRALDHETQTNPKPGGGSARQAGVNDAHLSGQSTDPAAD